MQTRIWVSATAALLLTACGEMPSSSSAPDDGFINKLPEGVLAVAASGQNLNAVKIDPTDGCYVYRYAGPVETTFLPLRSVDGRPICTRAPAPVVTG